MFFKLSLGSRLKDKNEEKEYFSNGYRLKRASRPRRAVYFWCLEAPTFIHQSEVFCFFQIIQLCIKYVEMESVREEGFLCEDELLP